MGPMSVARARATAVAFFLTCLMAAGCGGSPSEPSTTVGAITISSVGASPAALQITIGSRVRFTNTDTVAHSIVSDPHPDNNECPEINQVGLLAPGQSRETGNFVEARQCGFHEFNSPFTASWKGTITIK